MRARPFNPRLTGWIALVAVLLATLAPAVSQALGARMGANWVEVCTLQGARWVDEAADGTGPAPPVAQLLEHCPYCSLHAPVLGLPPSRLPQLPVVAGRAAAPTPADHGVLLQPAWLHAPPRAPPPSLPIA